MPAPPSRRGSGLTSLETRLAEQYGSVLDYVSRCAQAIDDPDGDWCYLGDKAGALAHAAERLAAVAGEAVDAQRRNAPTPRPVVVRAAVAWFGRHYRAARLLHPTEPDAKGGAAP
jgi:hypothetical protein